MKSFKTRDHREFFKIFMEIQAIRYKFNAREVELGATFLWFKYTYTRNPLQVMVAEERNGVMEQVLDTPSMIEQLKDIRTLTEIKKNLNMSNTILRKHVTGLKEKGFFKDGEVSIDFETDGNSIGFNISVNG